MLFVSQIAGLQIPTVKAQEEECLKIYYDSEKGYYYFWTLNREKVVLERNGTAFLNRWDGEAWINFGSFPSVGEVEIEVEAELAENKLKWKGKWKFGEEEVEVEIELEPKNISEYGDLEWSMKLTEKPVINVFSMPIQSENLKFYYQPPLYEEYGFSEPFSNSTFSVNATHVMRLINGTWVNEAYRPENVVGSYAVYHATKGNMHRSKEEAEKYKAGKAFHIYRPKLIDAEGKTAWANLSIDEKNGVLTITLPQEFLDEAVYPVTVDPTFGYETAGASTSYTLKYYILGSKFPLTENGNATEITAYVDSSSGASGAYAIYDSGKNYVSSTQTGTFPISASWFTLSFSSPIQLTTGDYWLVGWGTGNHAHIYYDTGDAGRGGYYFYSGSNFPNWPSSVPLTEYNRLHSIYCTYTAEAPGGEEYSHTFIETLNPSATLSLWQAQAYTFTQTLVTISTYNYGAEAIYTFTQTIKPSEIITYLQEQYYMFTETSTSSAFLNQLQEQIWLMQETLQSSSMHSYLQEQSYILIQSITPSETVTYMQEQQYIMTETVNPSSSFQHWIEGITVFIETFTETIQPKTTMHYWIEISYTFTATSNPTATLNYAMELTETFITIIETLKPKTTMIPILPPTPPEETNFAFVLAAFAFVMSIVALTAALTAKRD